ncbi:MAG TPA: outer membrane beta-barrel protein [Pyrinomonadaceae bacterium]|nr:outer membrane beta-barrel protein [Pyrinomonadaceae bacterium]
MNRIVGNLVGLTLLLVCSHGQAQQPEPAKLEIGAQFSSLTLTEPGVKREVGIGGRLTYNLTDNLAIEAEGNYFPSGSTTGFAPGGSILQGQFGLKAGKRWEKFGVYAKARPGFVSFDGTFEPKLIGTTAINGVQFPVYDFERIIRSTNFSMDLGGVVEAYPSRRVIVRFDAGDTMIRYGSHNELDFSRTPELFQAPARTTHNFQFSAGVGFRLLAPKDDSRSDSQGPAATSRNDRAPRFEVGAHLTSLTFNAPRELVALPVIPSGRNSPQTETGLGGRFTLNLNDSIGLESEINYFPTSDGIAAGVTGRLLQGQFGVKAGKRFKRFGFFGKVRPGFVSFDRSLNLVGTRPFNFGGITFVLGIFEMGRRTFFANDLGGVLEFYPSRRWALRFDAGDTIIHYGERSVGTFFLNPSFITAPPETNHNFQFTSGFSFRF